MTSKSTVVKIEWKYDGRHVQLVGSFNRWKLGTKMYRHNDRFVEYVRLGPGKHEYKFCVDHYNWWYDMEKPTISDNNGNVNNLLYVTEGNLEGSGSGITSFIWTYNPFATLCTVYGEWNDWEEGYKLDKCGEDWIATVRMHPGRYQYKFYIDDEWLYDMSEPVERDECGNINNMREVKEISDMNVFAIGNTSYAEEAKTAGFDIIESWEEQIRRQIEKEMEKKMEEKIKQKIEEAVARAEKNALAKLMAREKNVPPLVLNELTSTEKERSSLPIAAMTPRGAGNLGFVSPRGVGKTSAPTPRSAREKDPHQIITKKV